MKIAICVTGICRGNIKRNMDLVKEKFDGDFFYGTWKGRENDMSKAGIKDFHVFDEPKMYYHPLADVPEDVMPPVFKTWELRKRVATDLVLRSKMEHYTKQILGHAYILKEIPEEYDMIVRVRYDTLISNKVDFTSHVEESYQEKKAIGFGTRTSRHPDLHKLKVLPHAWPDRHGPTPGVSNDWGGYIMDPLILHPREIFDVDRAWTLHKEKKLLPAERGWYQVLSQPYNDNHESIYGGAQIEKYLSQTNQ